MTDNSVLEPGTVLNGCYYIQEALGRGGFGITYRAFDQKKQCIVAIKEFFPEKMAYRNSKESKEVRIVSGYEVMYDDQQKKYMREAGVLLELYDLPGIVHVTNFFYENNTAYMAMDYIEGISLEEYLNRQGGHLSWQHTLSIMEPLLRSLEAVHKRHILHRDISPDNILITPDGRVVLVDFGAAGTYVEEGDLGEKSAYLKYGYAAKEQLSLGEPQGNYTDIYAICVTIYRMMTGIRPPSALDRLKGGKIKKLGRFNTTAGIPRHIEKAIMRGLALEGRDRQQSIGELYSQIYATEEERVNAGLKKTQKIMVAVTATVLVVIIASVALLLAFHNRKDQTDNYESQSKSEIQQTVQSQEMQQQTQSTSKFITRSETNTTINAEPETDATTATQQNPLEGMEDQNTVDITVVKKGILYGYDGNLTMERIFDSYFEQGIWQEPQTGTVVYMGLKSTDYYAFYFTVENEETYELNRIAKNGTTVTDINACFDGIIYELGLN